MTSRVTVFLKPADKKGEAKRLAKSADEIAKALYKPSVFRPSIDDVLEIFANSRRNRG